MSVAVNYGALKEIQMQADEIAYMENVIREMPKGGLMVEWGSGGSTVRWLDTMKDDNYLVSIEHNQDWYNKVHSTVQDLRGFDNFDYLWRPSDVAGYEHGYASITEEHPVGLGSYIKPNSDIFDADIFFIDGIARATCALAVLGLSTKKDPAIFIHDWAGREAWYAWAVEMFPKHEQVGTTLVRLYK